MRTYKFTLIGLVAATALWTLTVSLDLDLFEAFSACMQSHEHMESDEIFFPAALLYACVMIDLLRKHQQNRIEIERLKVYRSMMSAMNHILNNFLQKMLLFKLTAEETEGFNATILKQYDTIINETTAQINALGCLDNPDEENILKTIDHPL